MSKFGIKTDMKYRIVNLTKIYGFSICNVQDFYPFL